MVFTFMKLVVKELGVMACEQAKKNLSAVQPVELFIL